MKLYVFNPDSDMALAHNDENYMAPAPIRQMEHDLALLPIWYAQPRSAVLAPSAYNAAYLKTMQQIFSLPIQLITEPELPEYAEAQVMPWGWNRAIRKRLLNGGIPECKLPTAERLAEYRKLSSRETSMDILGVFDLEEEEWACGQSYCLSLLYSCEEFVKMFKPCILKAPWSGSGKGLNWCQGTFTKSIEGWCERVLREQGFVVGEPFYNKVVDFAMEFYSNGHGELLFVGYSLFTTNKTGAYNGNVLMSSSAIEKEIEKYVSLAVLVRLRERMRTMLLEKYGASYTGYLGVDMMVCLLRDNRYAIHPCVEINMRMNMGVVSCLFYKNFMMPESTGHFYIESNPTNSELQEKHERNLKDFPLLVENGRIVSGYLPLVPVSKQCRYRAYVMVEVHQSH